VTGPIWQKSDTTVDDRIMRFLAGEDVILDRQLFVYDIAASKAHVRGLARIDVLHADESEQILGELDALQDAFESGEFVLDERFEDCHSAIEFWLTETLGDIGKKVHTGRSRNDQILVATRLYLRDQLLDLVARCKDVASRALDRARAHRDEPMPGYTHMQRAVPSSLGMWFAGFAEAFIDDAMLAASTLDWISANPLGTAAGYGVNLPLDREGVTEELGFERTQLNPIYAQNSRGKFELQALDALGQALLDVRRLSWDLSLFTTHEFAFADLPERFMTGSSIMPNKRNPDVVELLRAAYAVVPGARSELESLLSLPSGYHRDLQGTKGPLLRAMRRGLDALALVGELVEQLEFDTERLREAINSEMYATDRAVELTSEGVPFREAYRRVARELDELGDRTADDSIDARTSPGACADLRLDELAQRLDSLG
jgi:argininosuccinate lyase